MRIPQYSRRLYSPRPPAPGTGNRALALIGGLLFHAGLIVTVFIEALFAPFGGLRMRRRK